MLKILAQIISRMFGPFSVLPLVGLYLLLWHTGLTDGMRIHLGGWLLVTNIVLPFSVMITAFLTHRISDLDISKREERLPVLIPVAVSLWIGLVVAFILPATLLFRELLVFATATLTVAMLITGVEKISLHMVGFWITGLVAVETLGWSVFSLLPVAVIVAWARYYLKKHTFAQLIWGSVLPIVLLLTVKVGVLKYY